MQSITIASLAKPFDHANVAGLEHHSFPCGEELDVVSGILALVPTVRDWDPKDRRKHPPRFLEIGTYIGANVVQLSRMVSGAEIHSLNILPRDVQAAPSWGEILPAEEVGWFARAMNVGYSQHFGDSRSFDFDSLGYFDAIFVDGNHETEYVLSDTARTLPRLRPGGVIIWHDVTLETEAGRQVMGAIDQIDRDLGGRVSQVAGTWLAFWQRPNDAP